MKDRASKWYELQEFVNYGEAKGTFFNNYWGNAAQSRFREKIYRRSYSASEGLSMVEYAVKLAREAKYLRPVIPETDILSCVKQHFADGVARELKPSLTNNLSDMCSLLNNIERTEKLRIKKESEKEDRKNER